MPSPKDSDLPADIEYHFGLDDTFAPGENIPKNEDALKDKNADASAKKNLETQAYKSEDVQAYKHVEAQAYKSVDVQAHKSGNGQEYKSAHAQNVSATLSTPDSIEQSLPTLSGASADIAPRGIRSRWQNDESSQRQETRTEKSASLDLQAAKRRWRMIALICSLSVFLAFCAAFKDLKSLSQGRQIFVALAGGAAVNAGMTPLAMVLFNTIRAEPNSEYILLNWANGMADKNTSAAEPLYDELVKAKPTFASGFMNRARNLADIKRVPEALADYDRAILLNNSYSLAYNNRGHQFFEGGRYDKAIADYTKALETNGRYGNPLRNFIWFNRGYCYMDLKRWQEAIDDYDDAIEHGYKDTWVYNNRGWCLQNLDKFQEAIKDYNVALELDPKNKHALQGRAYCYEKTGDKRSVDDRQKADKLPDDG